MGIRLLFSTRSLPFDAMGQPWWSPDEGLRHAAIHCGRNVASTLKAGPAHSLLHFPIGTQAQQLPSPTAVA